MAVETGAEAVMRVTESALPPLRKALKVLSLRHVYAIDEALATLGAYGEVRLIKNRGRLRFIETVRSEDLGAAE